MAVEFSRLPRARRPYRCLTWASTGGLLYRFRERDYRSRRRLATARPRKHSPRLHQPRCQRPQPRGPSRCGRGPALLAVGAELFDGAIRVGPPSDRGVNEHKRASATTSGCQHLDPSLAFGVLLPQQRRPRALPNSPVLPRLRYDSHDAASPPFENPITCLHDLKSSDPRCTA